MPERKSLLVLTDAYPFGHSENFFEDELEVLRERFGKIVVVPSRRCDWNVPKLETPPGVEAHAVPLASRLARLTHALRSLRASPRLARWVLVEALRRPDIWLEPRGWHLLLWFTWHAARTLEDARQAMSEHRLRPSETTVYSYWSWPSALSAVLLKRELPELRALARCHGGDLYEERHQPVYLPFRRLLSQRLDHVVFISQQGLDYFADRWRAPREKLSLARLGVFEPRGRSKPSFGADQQAPLELVSCSFAVAVKRLPLMMEVVKAIATSRPTRRVRWTHLGAGPLFGELEQGARRLEGTNLSVRLLGHLAPADVTHFYVENPVDLFLNTSQSEGVPVSIMEAFACGIPVVAPSVGGVPEIVDDSCGRLFERDASPQVIAQQLEACVADPAVHDQLRAGARERWASRYDGRANFERIATLLRG
jgi:glycosyltransferase involved in cell wall biosynthesis